MFRYTFVYVYLFFDRKSMFQDSKSRWLLYILALVLIVLIVAVQFLWWKEKGVFVQEEPKEVDILDMLEIPVSLTVKQFSKLAAQKDWTLIDIRNEWELKHTGVIPWIDLHKNVYNEKHVADLESLPKEGKYLIYCAHANRTRMLREYLVSLWFESVHDLSWGIAAWEEEGYPLLSWQEQYEDYELTEFGTWSCEISEDCTTPGEYLVQSDCPYESVCFAWKCTVVCSKEFR